MNAVDVAKEDRLQRNFPVPKLAFAGWVPDTATAVYTFTRANKPGFARLVKADFCNVSGGAAGVTVRIVPAGETITDDKWNLIDSGNGGALDDGQSLIGTKDEETDYLFDGDRLVLVATATDGITGRIVVEEVK